MTDSLFLARLQFAITVGFHFIFPPISIGLAWLLVIIEGSGFKTGKEIYIKLGKFFGKLFALTFAVGVATGIVMEFQFGTNWSEYSKFVGDIFGAPLAAEGVFAFFLESTFLGLYLFGRDKVSKGVHFFSILMVAVGATISAFWILVANSWQQTPAGYIIQNNRAELTDFWAAVFNDSTLIRFFHTFDAALITGAFFVAGISAYLILKNKEVVTAKKSLKLAVIFGLVVSLMELYPFGHHHALEVLHTQPEKFAAIQGVYQSGSDVPMHIFGIVDEKLPSISHDIHIPGMLSWLAYGDTEAYIRGVDSFPRDDLPPFWMTFVSYHNMVMLGMFFIGVMALAVFLLMKKKLYTSRWFLRILIISIPLPVLSCEFGWVAAEVGRQPWIVYKLLRTEQAVSVVVSRGEVLFSIILFSLIYLLLFILYVYVLTKKIKHGPEPLSGKEVTA